MIISAMGNLAYSGQKNFSNTVDLAFLDEDPPICKVEEINDLVEGFK